MRRKVAFILSLSVLLASLLCVGFKAVEVKATEGTGTAQVYEVEMLWNNSMSVNDVAVSKDGNYIAAVNNTGLYYFAANSSSPRWWENPPTYFISVAISADGEYVVVGSTEGYIYYFNNSRSRMGASGAPTWGSIWMQGPIDRGSLDMSDDGNYVVVGGTDVNVWFYAGCTNKSGPDQPATWVDYLSSDVYVVDISPDGRFVAAGGAPGLAGGFVGFYKDAHNATSPPKLWHARSSLNFPIRGLALSDDGYAVVAVDEATIGALYYWANATELSGDPNATWTNNGTFNCVDMSADGDEVVAGTAPPLPCGLHFWTGARGRSGPDQVENWTRLEGEVVFDVAMSDNGGVIAASTMTGIASDYKACFFKSDGSMIGEFDLLYPTPFVSMSGDGSIVAMGGPGLESLYVFIPEFPSFLILPLFMIATLLAVIVYRRKCERQG